MIKIENNNDKVTVQVEVDEDKLSKLAAELEAGIYSVSMIWLKKGVDINTIHRWLSMAYNRANNKLMEGGGVLH